MWNNRGFLLFGFWIGVDGLSVCLGILYFDNLLTYVSVESFQYLTFISLLIVLLLKLSIKMIL
jgi:hypothetical protein